jgi:uncharacterized protein (DUF2236 family)
MANNKVQEYFSKKFRALLSNDPSGIPPWLETIAEGNTGGLFLPSDAPWVVHRDFGTLVGGIRALLVQALHPGALNGVANHSRYQQDALGRLDGTIRWLTVTTFGSFEAVKAESTRVNRLHDRVSGSYETASGKTRNYQAADKDLLLWVHVAFTKSFLVAHQLYADRPIPGGADAYVSQWARSVSQLGLDRAPMTEQELDETIKSFADRNEIFGNEKTVEVIRFIREPGLPRLAMGVYRVLFAAAVYSLEPGIRQALRLKAPPKWLIVPTTRFLLKAIRWVIGPDSPIEDGALARLSRLGIWPK